MDSSFIAFLNKNNSRVMGNIAYLFAFLGMLFLVQHTIHSWTVLSEVHYLLYIVLHSLLIAVSVLYIIISRFVLVRSQSPTFDRYLNLVFLFIYLSIIVGLNVLDLQYSFELIPFMLGLMFLVVLYREHRFIQIIIVLMPVVVLLIIIRIIISDRNSLNMLTFYILVYGVVALFVSLILYRSFFERFTIMHQLNDRSCMLDDLNSKLHAYKVSMERDLGLAEKIQRVYLENRSESLDTWDIATRYVPKNGVSGDFYDFYHADNTLHGVSLFDVTGHGVASSLVTMLAKRILSRLISANPDAPLGEVAKLFNQELIAEIGNSHIYLAGVILKINENSFEYINAGHTDIVIKHADGSIENVLKSTEDRNPFFCLQEYKSRYRAKNFPLRDGDTLIMATDGIYELIPAKKGQQLSFESIGRFISTIPPETGADDLADQIMNFVALTSARTDFDDDMTLLVLRYKS